MRPQDPIEGLIQNREHAERTHRIGSGSTRTEKLLKAGKRVLAVTTVPAVAASLYVSAKKDDEVLRRQEQQVPVVQMTDQNGLTPEQAADKAKADAEIRAQEKTAVESGGPIQIQTVIDQNSGR